MIGLFGTIIVSCADIVKQQLTSCRALSRIDSGWSAEAKVTGIALSLKDAASPEYIAVGRKGQEGRLTKKDGRVLCWAINAAATKQANRPEQSPCVK